MNGESSWRAIESTVVTVKGGEGITKGVPCNRLCFVGWLLGLFVGWLLFGLLVDWVVRALGEIRIPIFQWTVRRNTGVLISSKYSYHPINQLATCVSYSLGLSYCTEYYLGVSFYSSSNPCLVRDGWSGGLLLVWFGLGLVG